MIEVRNLKKDYVSGTGKKRKIFTAVNDVSFRVLDGETLGIIGESGCGKSTLAKMILRLLPVTKGEVFIDDRNLMDLKGKQLREMRKEIQIMFQNPETALDPYMRIGQSIKEVLRLNGVVSGGYREEKEKIQELISRVGLSEEHLTRYPHELSGGQIQRAVLARILALSPRILVADEPTSMLDVSVQAHILTILKELQNESNCSMIFIAHDLDVIRIMCDRVLVMYQGNIVEEGCTEEIFKDPKENYTRRLILEFYAEDGENESAGSI